MLYTTSIRLPKLFSVEEGNTQIDTNFSSINRSIALILLTGKGEFFGHPDFGSDIKKYQFREITSEIIGLLADEIVQSITKYESRVMLTTNDIKIEQVEDRLKINISYYLRNSNLLGTADVIIPMPIPQEV
jgi:phage baseplate assembly protein W